MEIKITFLGTGSMIPTKKRNHQAIFVSYRNEGILIDCGEGTQIQMIKAGIQFSKVTKILLSHWHGDHTLGLIGLITSRTTLAPGKKIEVYGPKGTKKKIKTLLEIYGTHTFADYGGLTVHDIEEGKFFGNTDFELESVKLEHSLSSYGFIFREKSKRKVDTKKLERVGLTSGPVVGKLVNGKKIKYKGKTIKPEEVSDLVKGKKIGIIADTRTCKGAEKIAKDCDLLISESSYNSEMSHKAKEYTHMTSQQAGKIAAKQGVKTLVLTHFSARYRNCDDLLKEAKKEFKNTVCASDFMEIKV